MSAVNKGRRRFLIAAGAGTSGLVVGSWWFYRKRNLMPAPDALKAADGETILNAWIKITDDNRIVVQVPRQEMGQGVLTSLPMLVAEELDVSMSQVDYEQAPIDSVYGNAVMFGEGVPFRPDDESMIAEFMRLTQFKVGRVLGMQATGGSSSVRDAWQPMRQAGATARTMLVQAAGAKFGVAVDELSVSDGVVSHAASGQSATYGELADAAAGLDMPADVELKSESAFTIIGTPQPRLDIPEKVDGSAQFGLDARPEGMVYAALRHVPAFGGSIASYDGHAASEMPGVRKVMQLPQTSMSNAAIVVVADHYWQAKKALAAVNVEFDSGPNGAHDTQAQRERFATMLNEEDGRTYDDAGDLASSFEHAASSIEAQYFAPYLAHATMEPINCTAVVNSDRSAELWLGNQGPPMVRVVAARVADVDPEKVVVHTPHLGGGFGRRGEMDAVIQAAAIANEMKDTPVQLIWSREEDIQHDLYRPMGLANMRAAFDDDGALQGFEAKVVGQSCMANITGRLMPGMESDLMKDRTTAEGLFDLPYAIPNRQVNQVLAHEPVPVGFWRSVGHSHHAYFAEAFIDECATAAGRDPFEFRRELLKHSPRHLKVLETVAAKANWGSPAHPGAAQGIALAESFGSIVAQVAEVTVSDGRVRVHRICSAIDCGFAVNPDTVEAQVQSAIVYGLTAALYGEITVKQGRVLQTNFPDYRMLSLADAPEMDVHIIESGIEHLGGIGEPGTPPVAPAVCNALYAHTGRRIRELPIRV